MFSKVCVLLLALGMSQAVPQMYMPEAGFMQFMLKSRALSQDNPARSLDCFDIYLPKLADVSAQYKADYAECLTIAEEARDKIDDTTTADRAKIDGAATDACKALTTCSALDDSVKYFECYTQAGSDNTKTMYTISADSSELLAVVTEQYRLIDNDKYLCTNKSDRTYVENSAKVYSDMEACLSGKEPSTSTSTTAEDSTSTTTTVSTTTEEDNSTSTTTTESTTTEEDTSTSTTTTESTTTEEDTSTSPLESTSTTAEENPSDKEKFPEEDLSRFSQEEQKIKNVLEDFKKWVKRH